MLLTVDFETKDYTQPIQNPTGSPKKKSSKAPLFIFLGCSGVIVLVSVLFGMFAYYGALPNSESDVKESTSSITAEEQKQLNESIQTIQNNQLNPEDYDF